MTIKRNRELYRDPSRGKVAGVCAGLADYFGMETWLVRILVVSGVLLGLHFFIVLYIAAWFILDRKGSKETGKHKEFGSSGASREASGLGSAKKASHAHDEDDTLERSIKVKAKIWQAGEPPKQAFRDIRYKFEKMESELRTIEKYVTSPEFTVSREINKL